MIARWQAGRSTIDALLHDKSLQSVHADRTLADLYLDHARAHLAASRQTIDIDPTGSFQLAYDAARKSLAAILENQGLRATAKGGHWVIEQSTRAQLDPPLGSLVNDFGWMRGVRNASEYPSFDRAVADKEDAERGQAIAEQILNAAARLLDQMPVY